MSISRRKLRGLQIIDIEEYGDIDISTLKEITPAELAAARGLDITLLFEDHVFVDRKIGYAIVHSSRIDKISPAPPPGFATKAFHAARTDGREGDPEKLLIDPYENWTANVLRVPRDLSRFSGASPSSGRLAPAELPWYVNHQLQWPELSGSDIHVAVFDSGIIKDAGRLPREIDHSDFCHCEGPAAETSDSLDGNPNEEQLHGTHCAGAIGATGNGAQRTSPAPNATIIAASIYRYDPRLYISLVDLLLMLSWIVAKRWTPAVVNMSFVLDRREVDRHRPDFLEEIVRRLRLNDLALIFAATKRRNTDTLTYPGRLRNVVAVSTYDILPDEQGNFFIQLPLGCKRQPWLEKEDLFFGPGSEVASCDRNDYVAFGEVSAACAYTAGVAALYLERYRDGASGGILETVVREMKARAQLFADPDPDLTGNHDWLGVGLYPDGTATRDPTIPIDVRCRNHRS
ncbi:S8 family peptidase [Tahibacter caeni]|uniref:S8 family peptidase n=1 Tax=Tahibacter caeni TaxID=1453545 RepID=UPI00214845B5|nr:S8/S53 family peptidase [Tahibacter caeni]